MIHYWSRTHTDSNTYLKKNKLIIVRITVSIKKGLKEKHFCHYYVENYPFKATYVAIINQASFSFKPFLSVCFFNSLLTDFLIAFLAFGIDIIFKINPNYTSTSKYHINETIMSVLQVTYPLNLSLLLNFPPTYRLIHFLLYRIIICRWTLHLSST